MLNRVYRKKYYSEFLVIDFSIQDVLCKGAFLKLHKIPA